MRCADLAHRFSPFSEKKVYGKMMLGKRGTAMHREPFQNQLRRSFIGYVAAILALILLLYLGGFALNFFAVIVRGCRRDNEALETALTESRMSYEVISAISKIYYTIYRIDLRTGYYEEAASEWQMHRLTGHSGRASVHMSEMSKQSTVAGVSALC